METKNDEIVDIKDEDVTEQDFTPEELADEAADWKAKAEALKGVAKRRATQLRKAKEALAKAAQIKPEAKPQDKEPSATDYSLIEKTFFKASGITDPDVMQLAKDFAKRTNETLDVVLEDEIFKARAERILTTKANDIASSAKTNRSGISTGRNSVDYWIAKGEHPPKELGRKIAEEYVKAKRNKGKDVKMFYND